MVDGKDHCRTGARKGKGRGDPVSRIAFVPDDALSPEQLAMLQSADANGAPNRNLLMVLAHRPELMEGFFRLWQDAFVRGGLDHRLKEILRVKIATLYSCGY